MITWSITAALNAGIFDRVVVSTDDQEIATIAESAGAEAPFIRPAHLADDQTPTVPVIAHAIEALALDPKTIAYVCCVFPCAPFIAPVDLAASVDVLKNKGVPYAYPVTKYPHPVQRAMRQLASGQMEFLRPEHELARTQDLDVAYHDAGQFYMGLAAAWLKGLRMHTAGVGMPIPAWRVVDIDDYESWHRAELLHQVMFPTVETGAAAE